MQEELEEGRKQLEALRELYELKCREVELLQVRLEESERRGEEEAVEREEKRQETIAYFEQLLL